MVIQTDADGTIYRGNLLVSLGWRYLFFLFRNKKTLSFFDKLIKLPFFYFLSYFPDYIGTAFIPFKGCPVELIKEVKNPLKWEWLNLVRKINPSKIIIISHQEKTVLKLFIKNNSELQKYNFEIIANTALIENGEFTGKSKIIITPRTKYKYINNDFYYVGDLRDYIFYRKRKRKFILI